LMAKRLPTGDSEYRPLVPQAPIEAELERAYNDERALDAQLAEAQREMQRLLLARAATATTQGQPSESELEVEPEPGAGGGA
jgi:hypothetical protein